MRKYLGRLASVFALVFVTMPVLQAHEVLELKAANYDAITGVWRDSSGNGNDAIGLDSPPSLTHGQTPNGSAVVTFNGTNFLTLTHSISAAGFTCFAYVRPTPGDSRTIVGGRTGSFQYRIGGDGFGDKQEVLQRNVQRLGESTTDVSTSRFSIISSAYAGVGGPFRLGEADDGTPRILFYAPIILVGAASGPAEFYIGDIAEIRIYNEILSDTDRAAIEEQVRKTYEP
jgi:hypothetical protein